MMISNFRKELGKNESGQAIILGAVSLLVLAVGIMSTAQLGWAIKERIQLQHAADNAAYTTATVVARSLNFISWTNRAMISQYVSAMAFQSLVSFLDSQLLMLAQICASLFTMSFILGIAGRALQVSIILSWLSPPFLAASRALATAGDKIRDPLLKKLKDGLDKFDGFIAKIVYGISIFNIANYKSQQLAKFYLDSYFGSEMIGSISSMLGLGGGSSAGGFYDEAISGTSKGANQELAGYKTIASALGSGWLDDTFLGKIFIGNKSLFDEKYKNIGTGSAESKRLEVLMTEMVNATRTGTGKITFETDRMGGLGGVIGSLVGRPGDGDHGDRLFNLLTGILPTTNGGGLMTTADGVISDGEGGYFGASSETRYKQFIGEKTTPKDNYGNHVFYGKGASKNPYQSRGEALLTADAAPSISSDLPKPLNYLMDFLSAGGEFFPVSKAVAIQAVGDSKPAKILKLFLSNKALDQLKGRTGYSGHCKYDDVTVDVKGVDCGVLMKNADKNYKECLKKCGDCAKEDENGNCLGRPTMENGTEYMSCSDCAKEYEKVKKSKESCEKGANSAGRAAEEVFSALFNGFPASVTIKCSNEKENNVERHRFWGVTPYVSFDAAGYSERQKDSHQEEYPSFWGFSHKNPVFMKGGAIGFGDKFNKNNKFNMSSVGAIEGVTSRDPGECNDAFSDGLKCSKDGYSFNHLDDEDVEFIQPGMHAWARAQVYYHRPGTWAEPPNFFNPYWKPKLSPIAPILTNQTDRLSSIPLIGKLLGKIAGEAIETVLSH